MGAPRKGKFSAPQPAQSQAKLILLSSWQILRLFIVGEEDSVYVILQKDCPRIHKVPSGGDAFENGIKSQHLSVPACIRLYRGAGWQGEMEEMGRQPSGGISFVQSIQW